MDMKVLIHEATDNQANYLMMNSTVLKIMAMDPAIQTLLSKSTFGNGDLFGKTAGGLIGVRPDVLGMLLDIGLVVYDEKYVVSEVLTTNLAASGTTVYVANASDFAAGSAKLKDISANTYETVTISAVDAVNGTITIGASTSAYKAGEDIIEQKINYMPSDRVTMFASTVDGSPIAEMMQAPFGLDRRWGLQVDQWDEKDPEGTFIRTRNKGLPVLYNRDAIVTYIIT